MTMIPGLRALDSMSMSSGDSESYTTPSPAGEDYPSSTYSSPFLPWFEPSQQQQQEISYHQDGLTPPPLDNIHQAWATTEEDLLGCSIHRGWPQYQRPIQIDVPFLVNLSQYGPQRLPTVFEDEEEEEDLLQEGTNTSSEYGTHHDQDGYATDHLPQQKQPPCTPSLPVDSPNPYTYVNCCDHDFDHDGPLLSQALQLHVLEEATQEEAARTTQSLQCSPPPPNSCHLVRPQALRVVCPTIIAPVVRHDYDDSTGHHYDYGDDSNLEDSSNDNHCSKDYSYWYRSFMMGKEDHEEPYDDSHVVGPPEVGERGE